MLRSLSVLAIVMATSIVATPVAFDRRSDRQYPEPYEIPPSSMTPQAWTDALNAAVSAGKIPDLPVASNQNGNPVYDGVDDSEVCSWTISKCYGPSDVHDALNNTMGLTFDDGPTNHSPELYDFLEKNSQSATHFMIASQILTEPDAFQQAVSLGNQHIASHTFSHQPLSSTLTNEQLVAELGWTQQIIYDKSGLIPSFWRPPQGDVDARVRAIAQEVFGLVTVLWNEDINDWCLHEDGSSECPGENPGEDYDSVAAAAEKHITKSDRSKGLIMLEHELTNQSISVFTNYYPKLAELGWVVSNVPQIWSADWYANAQNSTSAKTSQTDILPAFASKPSAPITTQSSASTTSAASTPSTAADQPSAPQSSPTFLSHRPVAPSKAQIDGVADLLTPSVRAITVIFAVACGFMML